MNIIPAGDSAPASVRLTEAHWAGRGASLALLRALDRALALLLLIATTPILLILALVTCSLSRRSPLVAHLRVGHGGVPFRMLKFRTMWTTLAPLPSEQVWVEGVESHEVREIKPQADSRVTSKFAAWCRVHSLDELPQLWHVVRGEMSLVGPRPLVASEIRTHYGDMATELLAVRPGMTGLWQVLGRNKLTYRRRRRLDLFLVRNYGWGIYWKLLLRTVPRVISGAGAW